MAMLATDAESVAPPVHPNYKGCVDATSRAMQYCNESLSHAARVSSLLAELTLAEKVGLIAPDPGLGSTCYAHIRPVPRVGLPGYGWLVEVNTGVASQCLGPNQCATTFSGPTGLGASFNRTVWSAKGAVLSTEMRALSNSNGIRGPGASYPGHPAKSAEPIGTSAFGPNINLIRDPRYGRNSEVPGEDPYHSGALGSAMVKAMQTPDAQGHPRVNAYLKHFDAYSTETNRMHSDFNITQFDFFDSYLPQYEMAFSTHSKAAGAMCSYTATNGVPSCANSWLLNDVLRKKWNRPDAYITTDCGAVRNVMGPPLNLKTQEEAAAATINGGTDLEMGTQIWNESMISAVHQGLVTDATITTAARRGLMQRMTQGDFDSTRSNGWSDLDAKKEVNSTAHQKIALDAALQSMVLLKNAKSVLPLTAGKKIAVIGPGALAQKSMVGPYFGDQICYAPYETRANRTYYCIPTVASQIAAMNDGGTTTSAIGVDWDSTNASSIPAALALAKAADIVILVLGIDHTIEHEGVDVKDNALPGLQLSFAAQVAALAKPTVLVLIGNDGTDIGTITPGVDAVVRAFYPATHGNKALATLLFGKANTWGKLPVTMYPAGYDAQLPAMGDRTGTAYAMVRTTGTIYLFPCLLTRNSYYGTYLLLYLLRRTGRDARTATTRDRRRSTPSGTGSRSRRSPSRAVRRLLMGLPSRWSAPWPTRGRGAGMRSSKYTMP